MQFKPFLDHLRQHLGSTVRVDFPFGAIRPNFHLTEVLRTQVHAMDCGGQTSQASHTVLQLVESSPLAAERELTAAKFLAILERSDQALHLDGESEVMVEFAPEGASAAQRFAVAAVQPMQGVLQITTAASRTQCKAAQRSGSVCGVAASTACCAPAGAANSRTQSPRTHAAGCCP